MRAFRKLAVVATGLATTTSSLAVAEVVYKPNWPRIQCKQPGKSFAYDPAGKLAPRSAAIAKCNAHGGVAKGSNPAAEQVIKCCPPPIKPKLIGTKPSATQKN